MSDAMCQMILRNMDQGADAVSALEKAFCERPSEVVALTVNPEVPDRIVWARLNKPMYIGFASHGAYLASTPLAFPDDVITEPQLLLACAAGDVCKTHYTVIPFQEPPASVVHTDALIRHNAYEIVCNILEKEPTRFANIAKQIKTLYPEGMIAQAHALGYEILYSLKKQGRLKVETRQVPAAREDLHAYQYYLSMME